MIGKLKGTVENIFEDHILLNVNDICYIIYCSTKLLQSLLIGSTTSLFTYMTKKDEIPILYGFADYQEKELFLILTSVQGVGGRMGMALISDLDYTTLSSAIHQQNPKILQQVPGIGAKIALRIINELKSNKRFITGQITDLSNEYVVQKDAVSALVNLGFRKADVVATVEKFIKENAKDSKLEDIIKNCISKLR